MLREWAGVHQIRRKDKGAPGRGQHAQGTAGCLGDPKYELGGRGKLEKEAGSNS